MDTETESYHENEEFYQKAVDYWSEIPPTINGMLGGFGHISQIDINGSKQFLKLLFQSKDPPGRTAVCDCGAGIGRISRNLLCPLFDKVDLVEQNATFLNQAREYIGDRYINKIGNFYNVGLQDFEPEPKKYDVIWCQWVLGHLTETHFIKFLNLCSLGLKDNGVIVIKENIASSKDTEVDDKDSSVTRPYHFYMELFETTNLRCLRKIKQTNFPKGIYAVYMFAIKPKTDNL